MTQLSSVRILCIIIGKLTT